MARAMKTSREELRKQFEALTEDPDVNFLMNDLMGKLGTDVQAQFELISGALGPDMSAAIIDAAHAATFTGTSAAADSVQRLWSEGAIETGNIVSELGEKLANGTMTIEEINKLQTKLKAGTLDQERLISGTLKAIGEGDYARRIQSQLAMFATTYGKSAEETQEAADELAQLTAKVKVAFGDVSIAFQRFALELMNSEAFQKALNWLATDGAKEIAGFIDYIRTKIPQLRGALESMFDFIIDIAPTLKEHWPLVAAGFGTALLAALTAPALLTGIGLAASKAIATMATRGLSMAGGGLMNLLKNIKLPTLAGAGRMLGGGVAGAVAWEAGSAAGDALYEAIGDKEWFTNFVDSALDIATGKSNLQIEIAKRMSQSEDKQLSAPIKTPAPAQVPATSNKTSAGTIPTPVPEQINSTTDKNNSNVITNELLRKIHAALGDVNTTLKTIDKLH